MDLVTAVRKQLARTESVTNLVGYSDTWQTWIFRWRLYVSPEGEQKTSVVIRQDGSWMNGRTSARFPRLQIEVYADDQRDDDGNPTGLGAHAVALETFEAVDAVLRLVEGNVEWGDSESSVRIISCERSTGEPDIMEIPGKDGMVRLIMRYQVTLA